MDRILNRFQRTYIPKRNQPLLRRPQRPSRVRSVSDIGGPVRAGSILRGASEQSDNVDSASDCDSYDFVDQLQPRDKGQKGQQARCCHKLREAIYGKSLVRAYRCAGACRRTWHELHLAAQDVQEEHRNSSGPVPPAIEDPYVNVPAAQYRRTDKEHRCGQRFQNAGILLCCFPGSHRHDP